MVAWSAIAPDPLQPHKKIIVPHDGRVDLVLSRTMQEGLRNRRRDHLFLTPLVPRLTSVCNPLHFSAPRSESCVRPSPHASFSQPACPLLLGSDCIVPRAVMPSIRKGIELNIRTWTQRSSLPRRKPKTCPACSGGFPSHPLGGEDFVWVTNAHQGA